MCGIVGYVGEDAAVPVLLDGLRRLEYRGYDSAGVAVRTPDGSLLLRKRAGRVEALAAAVAEGSDLAAARIGIGHTRWATHGGPSDDNAHPHADERQAVAVVHNGIIENHATLRAALEARGHAFRSQTDSEVVVHLVEEGLRAQRGGDGPARLRQAVLRAVSQLRGSFALVVLWAGAPDVLLAVRQQTPLVYGQGAGAGLLASDISALVPRTRRVVVLRDGEVAEVGRGGLRLFSFGGEPLPGRRPEEVGWDAAAAERGGYPHFMLKEIHDQPAALAETLRGRLTRDGPALGELAPETRQALATAPQAFLLGCGSAHHAGLVGAALLEGWARLAAAADLASEFRYRDPLVAPGALAVAISQSGETADTLAALREARGRGALGLAVTNAVGSTIAAEGDDRLPTLAGPEISVCSTKAYTTQLEVAALLALQAAALRGTLARDAVADLAAALRELPAWAAEALALEAHAAELALALAPHEHCFFIGRGLDHAVALEGQLKLKEISYMHAEAYAAGELKHGTLALVTAGTPVVAVFTQPHLAAKTASNVAEGRARGARVLGLCTAGLRDVAGPACDDLLTLPDVPGPLAPVVAAIPLQLLAYHVAVARGTDVDRPRNLAKSVTVE